MSLSYFVFIVVLFFLSNIYIIRTINKRYDDLWTDMIFNRSYDALLFRAIFKKLEITNEDIKKIYEEGKERLNDENLYYFTETYLSKLGKNVGGN